MNKVLVGMSFLVLSSCNDKHRYEVSEYLADDQEQLILDQAVRYMYYAEGIPPELRFDTTYDAKYRRATSNFYFARYHFTAPEETHTFLMMRRYPGERFRATGGMLEVDNNNKIVRFEEIFVTPLSREADVLEKGEFLFQQLVKRGAVDPEYHKMKSYIEWPDEYTTYDTTRHEWTRSGGD